MFRKTVVETGSSTDGLSHTEMHAPTPLEFHISFITRGKPFETVRPDSRQGVVRQRADSPARRRRENPRAEKKTVGVIRQAS